MTFRITSTTSSPTNLLELWGVRTHLCILQEAKEVHGTRYIGKRETLRTMSQASEGEQKARNQDSTTAVPTVPTFSVSLQSDYVIQGLVNGVAIDVLVDTGAAITVLSIEAWRKVGMKGRLFSTKRKLVGVQDTPL